MLYKHMSFQVFSLFIFILTLPAIAVADDSPRHQIVHGTEVYLGVMPSELVLGYPTMHNAIPIKKHRYHLLIALFDSKTGKRITNADVVAKVAEPGGFTTKKKKLEPMHVAEAPSYGNYFSMPDPGMYRIQIEIKFPEKNRITRTEFMFERPRD